MIGTVFGFKSAIAQRYTRDGHRVPVTVISSSPMTITQVKQPNTDGYWAIKVGVGIRELNRTTQPQRGQIRGAKKAPRFFREIRLVEGNDLTQIKVGDQISVPSVLNPGDVVDVSGVSKGKGFAGGVKRYHFKGGPRTHGQSDRARAVGAIGAHTYPGRTWPGQRMPGHYGVETKTVSGLVVLHIDPVNKEVWLSGPVPGANTSIVKIEKTGQKKTVELDLVAMGLASEEAVKEETTKEPVEEKVEETGTAKVEEKTEAKKVKEKAGETEKEKETVKSETVSQSAAKTETKSAEKPTKTEKKETELKK